MVMAIESKKTKILSLLGVLLGFVSIWVCDGDLTFFVFMSLICGMAFFSAGKDNNEKRVSKQDLKRGKYKESNYRVG